MLERVTLNYKFKTNDYPEWQFAEITDSSQENCILRILERFDPEIDYTDYIDDHFFSNCLHSAFQSESGVYIEILRGNSNA